MKMGWSCDGDTVFLGEPLSPEAALGPRGICELNFHGISEIPRAIQAFS